MRIEELPRQIDSIVLGNYILKHYGPMSHLKLQKLVYYCQAYHLAYFDSPLINDDFEAWVHGPVSRKLYDSLRNKSVLYADIAYSPIDGTDEDFEFDKLTSDQKNLITEVLDTLSKWTAIELERATHREKPWIEARGELSVAEKCSNTISRETMRTYYKQELTR